MNQGWTIHSLGDVSDFEGGSQPPKSYFVDAPREGYIRLLQIRDFKSEKYAVYIPIAKKNRTCEADDIMIGRYGASVGQIHRGKAGAYNVALIKTTPDESIIDKNFFYYYLTSDLFQKRLMSVADRSAQAGFSKADIAPFEMLLPPIPEQKRIVAILDEAFAGIDQAIANTEKNLASARELFLGGKATIFDRIKQEETNVPLAAVCSEIFAGGDAPRDNFSAEKTDKYHVPIIANAVKDNGLYGYTDLVRVTNPSVTVAARGSGTGHTEVRHYPFYPIVRLIVLTANPEKMNVDFLKYAVQDLEILRSGSAIPQLTVPMIKGYSVPLPSVPAQQKIVEILDAATVNCENLEHIYKQKLAALNDLKQSLLQKAFSGELTADALAEAAE